ncbi:unnamed protein product [Blepharisma stoltei]|uniref:Uncharacterized protein n=1 Tax=Blepharisma stoltei TaxID=1481888 RepID=A0AAU9K3S7_9CILI|nr:unnamed protein product [Blepharisma stoltei]
MESNQIPSELKADNQDHADFDAHPKYSAHGENSEVEINHLKELILIFRRSSEFLSLEDSLTLLCLNKYIRQHIANSEWETMVSAKAFSKFLEENYQADFISTLQEYDINFHNLYNNFVKSENLLKNPCGELGFQYWHKDGDWRFSKKGTWKNKSRCFCTSNSWAKLSQEIQLEDKQSRKILLAKSYVARRVDCDSTAQFTVEGYEYESWNTIFDTGKFLHPYNEVVKSPSCGWMKVDFMKVINPNNRILLNKWIWILNIFLIK